MVPRRSWTRSAPRSAAPRTVACSSMPTPVSGCSPPQCGQGAEVEAVELSRCGLRRRPPQPARRAGHGDLHVDAARWRPRPADAVVADPARTGLGQRATERLAATGARRFVLVSCDAASLARDARLLGDGGLRSRALDRRRPVPAHAPCGGGEPLRPALSGAARHSISAATDAAGDPPARPLRRCWCA